jgi:hypothetical protein
VGIGCPRGQVRRNLGVDKLAVDLVDDEEDVGVDADLAERAQLVGGEDHAGRVARGGDDEGPRARGDRGAHTLDREGEGLARVGSDRDDVDAEHVREAGVVGVVGLGDQDLVAGITGGRDREEQGLGAADGDEDLRGVDRRGAVGEGVVVGGERLAIVEVALGGAVGDDLVGEAGVGGAHRRDGVKVGLADVEVVHDDAAGLRRVGVGGEATDRRGGGGRAATGQGRRGHEAARGCGKSGRVSRGRGEDRGPAGIVAQAGELGVAAQLLTDELGGRRGCGGDLGEAQRQVRCLDGERPGGAEPHRCDAAAVLAEGDAVQEIGGAAQVLAPVSMDAEPQPGAAAQRQEAVLEGPLAGGLWGEAGEGRRGRAVSWRWRYGS